MTDLLSAFRGITTPTNELYEQIAQYGWEPTKVKWDSKLNAFAAEGRNVHGEKITKTGPDDKTALANLLGAIARHTQMRTAAQWKVGMWKTMFTDQLEAIAKAYAEAPVYDQKAAANFKELADDSVRRMETLKQQLHIEVVDNPEPYANAQEMAKDIHEKRHFYVSRANSEHPVWTVDQNVAFRTVHDVLGHAVSGGDFGWQGENLACAAHFPLLTPTAQAALFTECIAQTAYAGYYRSFGPQKVALFPQFYDPAFKAENDPNHRGVHPSQSIAPSTMPSVAPSKPTEDYGAYPEGSVAPHMEGLGLTPVMNPSTFASVRKYASLFADPNMGWSSGIDAMDPQIHGVGNAYLHHGDPLEHQNVMDTASKVDTGWSDFTKGDGTPDRQRMKQAIVNAFRVVLLSPRKDLRWNAIHYQDISHIPADTDDPKVYWDALEQKRQHWNAQQTKNLFEGKVSPETLQQMMEEASTSHQAWRKEWPKFFSTVFNLTGGDHKKAKEKADQMLIDWLTEEQQRIESEDAKKPADKQMSADLIERKAQQAMMKRMKAYIKDSQPKLDMFANAEQMGLDLEVPEETPPKIDRYGAFMGTHLKAIAQISQHADELLDAALKDVKSHDGSGHHFRAQTLALGISGVGPKVCSFAWLLLQPMTSQLATIDTHMMDVLGHHYEKEMNNRDYFKFERELAAGRDAAGYQHIPLGAFQWGMWDHKRTGPGSHQDHSAMRVLDPKPHDSIDWESKVKKLKGDSWLNQAPDWWKNTQQARDHVAQDWDENIAKTVPQNGIPYQIMNDQTRSAAVKESGESEDEFHVGVTLPESIIQRCSEVASAFTMEAEDPEDYHITMFWTTVGYSDRDLHDWIRNKSLSGLRFEDAKLDNFPGQDGRNAVVIRFHTAPEAKVLANELMDEAEERGLDIKRFPGGWKPHITLGWTDKPVDTDVDLNLNFRGGQLYVSIPRPLRKTAEFSKGFAYWWNKKKPFYPQDGKVMADYARGTRTSKEDSMKFIEAHKDDVRRDFDRFKRRFEDRFDSLRESSIGDDQTNMARLIEKHGLSTPEIWKMYAELPKEEDDGVLRDQKSVPA